jgi:hypothetical protein
MAGERPRVDYVTYAGLPSSPYNHRVARICPKGAGALFTFAVKGGYDACVKLIDNVELFSHVANLGDTRSLVIHSASTTHRQLSPRTAGGGGAGPERGAPVDRDRGCRRHHRRSAIRRWPRQPPEGHILRQRRQSQNGAHQDGGQQGAHDHSPYGCATIPIFDAARLPALWSFSFIWQKAALGKGNLRLGLADGGHSMIDRPDEAQFRPRFHG